MRVNIVIPMAGLGSRFSRAGYRDPKPLIKIHDVPMIKLVIDNLRPNCSHRFIFICQKEHVESHDLPEKLGRWAPQCEIVVIDKLTEGAACTVLMAKHFIDDNQPLMIANSDQYVDISIDDYLEQLDGQTTDGLIMTMRAHDPKWSFVGLDQDRLVRCVVEKQVISDEATVGIYNFKRGSDFVRAAETMIARDLRVNGEFYVAPVYNQLIEENRKIRIYNIGNDGESMHGLGTPEDLDKFLTLPLARRVAAAEVAA